MYAATVVTPATGGNCLNLAPGAYKVLSNIIITEVAVADMSIQAGTTLILTPPAGTEFRAGFGNVIFTAGRDIASASVTVTAVAITVTLNIPTNVNLDILRIRSIEVRSILPYSSGNVIRPVAGGTAVIAGNAPGAGVNHATLTTAGTGGTFTTLSNGNWSSSATWIGGVAPSCGDNVVIGHAVTVDGSYNVNNLTINTGGNLVTDNAVTVNGNFVMAGTGIYTHNNLTAASTTIFNGTESFAATSKIIISRWSSFMIPLPTGVTGDFGAIEFNTTGNWNHAGMFAPARIKGTMTINAGAITMDDGTGMTTALTLQDVVISGTGRFIAQSGTARNLTLNTGNFSDNSTNTGYTYLMFRSVGDLIWNVNGNLNMSHRFMMVEGVVATDVGSATVNITGNLAIGGGLFYGIRNATGPIAVTVNGTSSISGSPTLVAFKDNFPGDVTFNSGTTTISSGTSNFFMRGNTSVGVVDVNITGNLVISGATTRVYVSSSTANASNVSLDVSTDLILTDAQLYTATTPGNVSVGVVRNFTQSGATSVFFGQRQSTSTGNANLVVTGTHTISDGSFTQSSGFGNIDMDVVESMIIQNATFYGMNNLSAGNYGTASLNVTDLDISGSNFFLHRGEITDGRSVDVTIGNQMSVNFTNASQQVFFINRASNNNAVLNLNIGSNFFVTGTANGLFCTSISEGTENVTIGGDLSIAAGRVRFNAYEGVTARGHIVNGTISGSLIISGGSVSLSSHRFTSTWNIAGDYEQTGGYAVYKWNNGVSNITVQGNYSLINGTVHFYSRTGTATSDAVTLTVNGNATFENSTTVFDSCLTSTATHRMILQGANVTYGSNVVFTHISHLTTRTIFGSIIFNRAGTIVLRRNAASFDIRQVKQSITAGTTVNFATSPFDLMISSHVSATSLTHTTLDINGTLNMGTNMIAGRDQADYYASMNVNSGARIRTAHTNGFYSGSATPSCIYPMIGANLRMNFYLDANSTVEYNGIDSQRLTGTGVGVATTSGHRFGFLDINFGGTPDVEYVYLLGPDSVTIRTGLILTLGELNLNSNHNANGTGYFIHLLNNSTITRVAGYIRSETYNGTAAVKWMINNNGSYVIPFGKSSTEYIPFTYQPTAGGASGNTEFATNGVAADNTPYPPTITHVNSLSGTDNSNNTVDRFWRIAIQGNVTANLTFSSTASERAGVANPRAQLWYPVTPGWYLPAGVQSNPTASTTLASGQTAFNAWWALSSSASPLPVELVSFEATTDENQVRLDWITASEINNDYFTVERSNDGTNFTDLFNVEGAGNTSSVSNYKAFDQSPANGYNYYRLKQTDFDGTQKWSGVRMVSFKKKSQISVFPNPVAGNTININSSSDEEQILNVSVFDLAGKLIETVDGNSNIFARGSTEINLNNKLDQGTYMVEINTNGGVYRERIIKQ